MERGTAGGPQGRDAGTAGIISGCSSGRTGTQKASVPSRTRTMLLMACFGAGTSFLQVLTRRAWRTGCTTGSQTQAPASKSNQQKDVRCKIFEIGAIGLSTFSSLLGAFDRVQPVPLIVQIASTLAAWVAYKQMKTSCLSSAQNYNRTSLAVRMADCLQGVINSHD